MRSLYFTISYCTAIFCFIGCGPDADAPKSFDVPTPDQIVEQTVIREQQRFDSISNNDKKEGLLGVFDVPEMLAIIKLDSATMEETSAKRAKNYATIESEMKKIGAQAEGAPGSIYYNNDPKNFKFECVILIKEMPKIKPETCNIVVLEATKMLIYNFFGAYGNIPRAYEEIRKYCEENNLIQSGPLREFYLINPMMTKIETDWLTRIMVPVVQVK